MTELAEQGIKLNTNQIGNHKTTCPKCSHTRKKKSDPCLSVKLDTHGGAVWKCHNCEWSGSIKGGSTFAPNKAKAVKRPALPPKVETLRDQKLCDWFAGRGISENTLRVFAIYKTEMFFGQKNETCIAFPYVDGFELEEANNIKYRTADKRFRQEKDAVKTFYKCPDFKVHEATEIIFVEGEMDVLSLY